MALTVEAAREMCRQFRERGERLLEDRRRALSRIWCCAHLCVCGLLFPFDVPSLFRLVTAAAASAACLVQSVISSRLLLFEYCRHRRVWLEL